MKTLAFDGRMGASGDMILAALLDAGANRAVLEPIEATLPIEYKIDRTTKCGIESTTVDVLLTDDSATRETMSDGPQEQRNSTAEGQDQRRDTRGRDDDNDHNHDHAEGHGPHRSYREVREIVTALDLPEAIERDSLAIFEKLGTAEARVHGATLDEIHFHEVGADDAIADVVGAVCLLDDLAPDRVVTTPIAVGGGSVSMHHGEYPVPTPAVVEIASKASWQIRGGPVEAELLTPTGASILAHVATGTETIPPLALEDSGYGSGEYNLDPHPNVLRVLVGSETGSLVDDDIAVLETNLDDVSPEVLGSLQETLLTHDARDVTILPATMKKSRPGHVVKVICKPEDRERLAKLLAAETGTLGVRDAGVTHRWIATREIESIPLEIDDESYHVDVKVARNTDGTIYDVSAEFDDVQRIARATDIPVRTIQSRAETRARDAVIGKRD